MEDCTMPRFDRSLLAPLAFGATISACYAHHTVDEEVDTSGIEADGGVTDLDCDKVTDEDVEGQIRCDPDLRDGGAADAGKADGGTKPDGGGTTGGGSNGGFLGGLGGGATGGGTNGGFLGGLGGGSTSGTGFLGGLGGGSTGSTGGGNTGGRGR
jgi:hypothetical protein